MCFTRILRRWQIYILLAKGSHYVGDCIYVCSLVMYTFFSFVWQNVMQNKSFSYLLFYLITIIQSYFYVTSPGQYFPMNAQSNPTNGEQLCIDCFCIFGKGVFFIVILLHAKFQKTKKVAPRFVKMIMCPFKVLKKLWFQSCVIKNIKRWHFTFLSD